jgi:hypothetical protein
VETGKLEWVVNGYEAIERAGNSPQPALATSMPEFKLADMKFPEVQIGDLPAPQQPAISVPQQPAITEQPAIGMPQPVHVPHPAEPEDLPVAAKASEPPERARRSLPKLDPQALFKIVGADKKIYGPVSGQELAQWMSEGRVTVSTLIQKIGNKKWQQVAELLTKDLPQDIPIPPPLRRPFMRKDSGDKK